MSTDGVDGPVKPRLSERAFHIQSRLHGSPAMICPSFLGSIDPGAARPQAFEAPFGTYRGGQMSVDGRIATIEITGFLDYKNLSAQFWGDTDFDQIAENIRRVQADSSIEHVVFNIDSPGGMVAGSYDTHDLIASLDIPTTALVADQASSSAYLLACACDEVVVTQVGRVGSIGVVWTHFDYSRALEASGIRATHIYAGATKVDGSPYQPLSEDAIADQQAEIDVIYAQFVAKVAAQRPGMDVDAVRATEARTYTGEDAVSIGLADAVVSSHDFYAKLSAGGTTAPAQPQPPTEEVHSMALPTSEAELQALIDAARAEGRDAGTAEATAAADAAQQALADLTAAITGHAEAQGREQLAATLAASPGMTLDTAVSILSSAPKATTIDPAEQDHGIEEYGMTAEEVAEAGYNRIDREAYATSRRAAVDVVRNGFASRIAAANNTARGHF